MVFAAMVTAYESDNSSVFSTPSPKTKNQQHASKANQAHHLHHHFHANQHHHSNQQHANQLHHHHHGNHPSNHHPGVGGFGMGAHARTESHHASLRRKKPPKDPVVEQVEAVIGVSTLEKSQSLQVSALWIMDIF